MPHLVRTTRILLASLAAAGLSAAEATTISVPITGSFTGSLLGTPAQPGSVAGSNTLSDLLGQNFAFNIVFETGVAPVVTDPPAWASTAEVLSAGFVFGTASSVQITGPAVFDGFTSTQTVASVQRGSPVPAGVSMSINGTPVSGSVSGFDFTAWLPNTDPSGCGPLSPSTCNTGGIAAGLSFWGTQALVSDATVIPTHWQPGDMLFVMADIQEIVNHQTVGHVYYAATLTGNLESGLTLTPATLSVTAVPEPATWALTLGGLALFMARRRPRVAA